MTNRTQKDIQYIMGIQNNTHTHIPRNIYSITELDKLNIYNKIYNIDRIRRVSGVRAMQTPSTHTHHFL